MKDRIRQLMESQHMTQQTFAEFLGISPATLSSIFNERTRPTLALVAAIKQKLKTVNTDWLLLGTGDMYLSDADSEGKSSVASQSLHQGDTMRQDDLFDSSSVPGDTSNGFPTMAKMEDIVPYGVRQQNASSRGYRQQQSQTYAQQPIESAPRRQITEIRIFYSDQTWETFVPKK